MLVLHGQIYWLVAQIKAAQNWVLLVCLQINCVQITVKNTSIHHQQTHVQCQHLLLDTSWSCST